MVLELLHHLHSTIFILKRIANNPLAILKKFTFYNIYIKTIMPFLICYLVKDLHSTIFILKLTNKWFYCFILKNLHSTIFILKLFPLSSKTIGKIKFTFYNIYIKTGSKSILKT